MKKPILFTLLFLLAQVTVRAQWVQLTGNNYSGIDLTDVYANGNKIIAVGTKFSNFQGHIFISSDGGSHWDTMQVYPTGYFCKTIAFKDADTGFIGGYGSVSFWLKTVNGGQNWTWAFADAANSGINDMHFLDSKHGYATGYGPKQFKTGVSYHTSDGGITWNYADSADRGMLDSLPLDYAQFVTPAIGYGRPDFFSQKKILKSTDSGNTWSVIYTHTKVTSGIYFWDQNNGILIDVAGDVYKTTNGGTAWSLKTSNAFNSTVILSMSFLNASYGLAVGDQGRIFKTLDGGLNWTAETSPTTKTLWRVRFFNNRPYVAGVDGVVLRFGPGVGVGELAQDDGISVYPNPATGFLNIRSQSGSHTNLKASLYNLTGQLVLEKTIDASTGLLDVRHLPAGTYTLQLCSEAGTFRKMVNVSGR